jgi:oxygen-independent coproporphyrinogen-3 oxidase
VTGRPISLYIHVPFCTLKCSYCDFNSYARLEHLVPAYADALLSEIRTWAPILRERPVTTVYFGGGTPTLLPLQTIGGMLAAVREHFALEPSAEVTIEANPGTVDDGYLAGLVREGFNRISFGVQSFDDAELATLERIHDGAEAVRSYHAASAAGFPKIGLDLIYGLPGQEMEGWRANVEKALSLGASHLSFYALTVEEGTGLARDVSRGTMAGPDEDLQADMYEWASARLDRAGYRQYEISNWCLPGEECRHNLAYWRNMEWIGLGPGAHSHWGGFRFANVYSPRRYSELLAAPKTVNWPREGAAAVLEQLPHIVFAEEQSHEVEMADTVILALRLNEGLAFEHFRKRFGASAADLHARTIDRLSSCGLLEATAESVRLTPRGRLLANEVFVQLLPG